MTTTDISTHESDIFSVIRELEAAQSAPPSDNKDKEQVESRQPDPIRLKGSLEKKLELINLLEGNDYISKRDIAEIRLSLKEALTDLDKIIATTT